MGAPIRCSDAGVSETAGAVPPVLSVFPNPITGLAEVIFNAYSKEDAVLMMTDATGKIIEQELIPVVKGGNRLKLNLEAYRPGIYILPIVTKYKIHRTKLVKE